jgi:DNA-binding CsgD family transcriptional regulator
VLGHEPGEAPALLRFAQSLVACTSLEQLERAFVAGFPRVFDVPIYGFNVCDPVTMGREYVVAPSVSEVFVARYNYELWDVDPLRSNANTTRRTVYNLDLMSREEWEESWAYRRVYALHSMQHVVEAPMIGATGIVGNLHVATSVPEHGFGPKELELTEALGGVVAVAIENIRSHDALDLERNDLLDALEMIGTATVISDPRSRGLRLNDAAHRLLAEVVDGEGRLHTLLVRPTGDPNGGFSRRQEVELVNGDRAILHAHSRPAREQTGTLITVLELSREAPNISLGALATLTPREADVATLIVEGLTDREIAEHLCISRHTVSQHAKRVYSKLDVESRVGLTRLLLGVRASARRS